MAVIGRVLTGGVGILPPYKKAAGNAGRHETLHQINPIKV